MPPILGMKQGRYYIYICGSFDSELFGLVIP